MNDEFVRLFEANQKKNPYQYEILFTTKVKPPELSVEEYGHHRSVGVARGVRRWAFQTFAGYTKAIEKYSNEIVPS